MGVSAATAEFLAEARAAGVSFESTATIGRQALFVGPARVRRILERHSAYPDGLAIRDFAARFDLPAWADPLFEVLGARSIVAIDASDYEGAQVVHDLNEPLPDELRERFDVLVDSGSLEHVFDVPTALRSYMEMVKPGGHLILSVPANNLFGHGFYQFSAELFYRVFSEENGFEAERVELVEDDVDSSRPILGVTVPYERRGHRYEVVDPSAVRRRVLLENRRPTYLMVRARRLAAVEPLASAPQQSDYSAVWVESAEASGEQPAESRLGRALGPGQKARIGLDVIPRLLPLLDPLRNLRARRDRSFRNRRLYRRVD